jgi:hypoxanthine phosphoribosyltransferase
MDVSHVEQDLVNVLFTEKQIQDRLGELARDIERDYEGHDLLIVGILRGAVMVMADLTLSWLTSNLSSREPASVEICTLLRKPEALQMPVEVKYVGWDIPNEFVVGYGLDYRERYRNLRDIGTLAPHVYS